MPRTRRLRRQSPNSQQSQKEDSAGDCCRDSDTKSLISKSLLEPQNKDSNVSNGLDAKTLQTPNRQGKRDSAVHTEQERLFAAVPEAAEKSSLRPSMSGLDVPSLKQRKQRFLQAAASALQAAGVVPQKEMIASKKGTKKETENLEPALSPINESAPGIERISSIAESKTLLAMQVKEMHYKSPPCTRTPSGTNNIAKCVHIFTPGTTSNLARRFEALKQVEQPSEADESFRSPYVLTSSSGWAEEEMGTYYDRSFCGNDALRFQFENSACKAKVAGDAETAKESLAESEEASRNLRSFKKKQKNRNERSHDTSQTTEEASPIKASNRDNKKAEKVNGGAHTAGFEDILSILKGATVGVDVRNEGAAGAAGDISNDIENLKNQIVVQGQDSANAVHANIFGRRVFQACGREIYVASARTFLSNVPLWLEQRPCDLLRVQEIVRQKKDFPLFPGMISVFQYPRDVLLSLAVPQTRAIFDGQHRCLAMHAILQNVDAKRMSFSHKPFFAFYDKDGPKFGNVWQQLMETSAKDFDIMVEVFSVKSRQQIVDLYIEINKAQPVLEIDVPDVIATSKKLIIDQACAALHKLRRKKNAFTAQINPLLIRSVQCSYKKYKACFSHSTACRPPNVNLSVLRNALFRSKVLEMRPITSSDDLLALLEDINSKIMSRPQESWALVSNARALSKAREQGFFLGMTSCWIDKIAES